MKEDDRQRPPPPSPAGPAGAFNWTPIGPSTMAPGSNSPRVSGRVNAIVIGPGGQRVYAGAANGGVWRSVDGAASWRPLNDDAVSPSTVSAVDADALAVGAFTVRFGADPMGANDEVFVGTGEPFPVATPSYSSDGYYGVGVRHSTNGGGAWGPIEATNLAGNGIFRVTIDPDDPTLVLVASSAGLFRRPTVGGTGTYSAVAGLTGTVCDLVVAGSNATGNKVYYAAVWRDRVYTSPDGASWSPLPGLSLGGGFPSPDTRIALGVCEGSPSVVYALVSDGRLFRLVGGSFQQVINLPYAGYLASGGWSHNVVAVDPLNPDVVFLGGIYLFRGALTMVGGQYSFGSNGSASYGSDPTWVGQGVHADIHAINFALLPGGAAHDGAHVWVGCDGGVYHSPSGGALGTFDGSGNTGLATTEAFFLAQHPVTDAVLLAGTQDNGSLRCLGNQAWNATSQGGDGGGVAIDPNTPTNVMLLTWGSGQSLSTATDGGASGTWSPVVAPFLAEPGIDGGALVVSPPGTPTRVAYGTYRLWVSDTWGASWVTLPSNNDPYTSGGGPTQDTLDGNAVTAIAIASATRIFVATSAPNGSSASLWRIEKSGATWSKTDITAGLPAGRLITGIAVESAGGGVGGQGTIYATLGLSGYPHVWYHDGAAWTAAMPQSILDAAVNAAVVDPAHPEKVYVGGNLGCWQGVRTGTNWMWSPFSSGLPEAAIRDLQIHAPTRLLRAATHGRSVWEVQLDVPPPDPTRPDLYMRVNHADTGRLLAPGGKRYPFVEGAQDPTAPAFQVWHWMSADIKVRRPNITPLPPLGATVDYVDFERSIGDWVDSVTHIETADDSLGTSDRVFIQVHNRNPQTDVDGSQVTVLLLLADASASLPPLPSGYAANTAGKVMTNWPSGSGWVFADPGQPYRSPTGRLDARTPKVVEYQVDFAALGFGASTHVCAAAFVTTPLDPLTATEPSLDVLTMSDKHVVHRNLHMVTIPTQKPGPPPPRTFLLDFHNARPAQQTVDIELRADFPGHLSLVLPRIDLHGPGALRGVRVEEHGWLESALATHLGDWLEKAGEWIEQLGERVEQAGAALGGIPVPSDLREQRARKVRELDRSRVYVVDARPSATIGGLKLAAGGRITAAITVRAPAEARPGDRWRLDVLQRQGEAVIGGSSYYLVVPHRTATR